MPSECQIWHLRQRVERVTRWQRSGWRQCVKGIQRLAEGVPPVRMRQCVRQRVGVGMQRGVRIVRQRREERVCFLPTPVRERLRQRRATGVREVMVESHRRTHDRWRRSERVRDRSGHGAQIAPRCTPLRARAGSDARPPDTSRAARRAGSATRSALWVWQRRARADTAPGSQESGGALGVRRRARRSRRRRSTARGAHRRRRRRGRRCAARRSRQRHASAGRMRQRDDAERCFDHDDGGSVGGCMRTHAITVQQRTGGGAEASPAPPPTATCARRREDLQTP